MEITSEAVAFAFALVLSKTIDMLKKRKAKSEDIYDTLSATGKLAIGDVEIAKLPNKALAEEIKSAVYETYTNLGIVPRIIVKSEASAPGWKFLVVPDNIKVDQLADGRLVYTVDTATIPPQRRKEYLALIADSVQSGTTTIT